MAPTQCLLDASGRTFSCKAVGIRVYPSEDRWNTNQSGGLRTTHHIDSQEPGRKADTKKVPGLWHFRVRGGKAQAAIISEHGAWGLKRNTLK